MNEAASAAVPEGGFIMKVNRLPALATILLLAAIPSISLAEGGVKVGGVISQMYLQIESANF